MLLRVATIGGLVVAVVVIAILIFGGSSGHDYRLIFQTAGQLVKGNQVMVGGHPVGTVDSIGLTADNQAEVEVNVDQQLHEGTAAVIRTPSLSTEAGRYISLTPGPNNAPELADGATIGSNSTTTAVDLDQFFDTLDHKTRRGLSNWIRGAASVYAGDAAEQANETYKYSSTALSSTRRLFAALAADQPALRGFLHNTSGVVTSLASHSDRLTSLVSNSNQALGAIARENESFKQALEELPPTLRQANTTFVNLRAALDDVQPMIETTGRATKGLAPFLKRDLNPVLKRAVPVFGNLSEAVYRPGADNDLADLTRTLIPLHKKAGPASRAAVGAMNASQDDVANTRPYTPDILSSFAKLGQLSGYYDGDGHYVRVRPSSTGLFQLSGSNQITPESTSSFGGARFVTPSTRCPGGATQPIAGSNPFLDDGNLNGKCNPSQVPPGN